MSHSMTSSPSVSASESSCSSSDQEDEFFDANASEEEEQANIERASGEDASKGGLRDPPLAPQKEPTKSQPRSSEDSFAGAKEWLQRQKPRSENVMRREMSLEGSTYRTAREGEAGERVSPEAEDAKSVAATEAFPVPTRPPRRVKAKASAPSTVPTVVVAPPGSPSPVREILVTDAIWKEKAGPLLLKSMITFVDDIVSIQGDLSVNEAILTGDRQSVCVDEVNERRSVFNEEEVLEPKNNGEDNFEEIDNNGIKVEIVAASEAASSEPVDEQILGQIMIKNIDTGECLPLSQADELVTKCINPLNLHLLKITNDYNSDAEEPSDLVSQTTEAVAQDVALNDPELGGPSKAEQITRKALKNVRKIGRGVIKGVKQGVNRHTVAGKEGSGALADQKQVHPRDEAEAHQTFKLKLNKKSSADFDGLRLIQELNDCRGAIWCMKWSVCGQLLAVAGQDQLLRVYCGFKAWKYFTQLRSKASGQQTSPSSTKDRSLSGSRSNSMSSADNLSFEGISNVASRNWSEDNTLSEEGPLLLFSAYRGHTADVLDISWSKNHFLLSSSMDKTVRLWHVTRVECLCTLRHADFVTTIQFHPRDDRYFLSGSLDGKLRLWNIPDKRVTLWNEVTALPTQARGNSKTAPASPAHGLITSSAFVQNGKFAVIGTYDGRVIFFSTDQLKYFTQLHVSGGKSLNATQSTTAPGSDRKRKRNNKVTGIEGVDETKILVTTNDSRIRLYDLRDLSLACKYKGCINVSSQIRASISHDNRYIVCGSENSSFYIWRLQETTAIGQRRDRNHHWECVRLLPVTSSSSSDKSAPSSQSAPNSTRTTPGIVTAATFAPLPMLLDETAKYVIAAADFSGTIRLFSK